jgi:hypothetical protein
MKSIHHFIRSDGSDTDTDLVGMIRTGVLECAPGERKGWLKQLELSLDGYGGRLSQRAERVRGLLKQVEAEIREL